MDVGVSHIRSPPSVISIIQDTIAKLRHPLLSFPFFLLLSPCRSQCHSHTHDPDNLRPAPHWSSRSVAGEGKVKLTDTHSTPTRPDPGGGQKDSRRGGEVAWSGVEWRGGRPALLGH